MAKTMDLTRRRVQLLLFVVGVIALSMAAEKFREVIGEEAASKSGKFTFLNCLDMGSGSVACAAKEGVKLYVYSIRNAHVENARLLATEQALTESLKEGLGPSEAAKQAQRAGKKAAKLATRQAKRILGPLISSCWDFFEAIYFGGSMTEGFLRGTGTLFGTYAFGYHGDQQLGKLGYLAGSHFGSWVGGRIGLMVYDIVNGVKFFISFVEPEQSTNSVAGSEDSNPEYTYREAETVEDSSPEYTYRASETVDGNEDTISEYAYRAAENSEYDVSNDESSYSESSYERRDAFEL